MIHWRGDDGVEPACTYHWDSMAVSVTRQDRRTWIVTTDALSGSFAGDLAVMADNTGAGPINDNTGAVPIGLYHLPFRLMVDCPKCP